ncbi:MAG: hypothetical protein P8J20_09775 [Novosphingobium sp.]|nr:hypothetical protein [Novosphingobium sp.]
MNLTRDRLRSIGWVTLLTLCLALTAGLTLRVNAVKSEVYQAESRIVSTRSKITFLETEYQTRSNQQQLKALNDVEFGYMAPRAQQYIEGERQLAVLGKPREPGAPAQIRVAAVDAGTKRTSFLPMLSPVGSVAQDSGAASPAGEVSETAAPLAYQETSEEDPIGAAIDAESLGERLARIGPVTAEPVKAE